MENIKKMEKDLNYKGYTTADINYLIEFSFVIGRSFHNNLEKLNNLYDSYVGGIGVYSLFVKFCYENYINSDTRDYLIYINMNIDKLLNQFIKEYFE